MALDKLALIMSLLNKDSGGNNSKPIDSQVNSESENPVQNKAIYDFVNSSVASNTAYFKGTFDELTELESIADATNNDYAFVISVDSNGNTVYNRYKYSDNKWIFEYALNNSSFTANQWNTINSGITYADIQRLEAEKVDKISGKGLSTEDFTTADKQKLANLENYDDSEVKTDIATNSSAITVLTNSGQKNLLKNTAVSKTQNGVTFTVNADGTVSVSGTATAGVTLPIGQVEVEKGRTYALSGCPAGGSSLTYRLDARYYKNGTLTTIGSTIDVGEGTVIKLPEDADDNRLLIYIRIGDGTDGGGRIFTPMLRYAEIVDDAYKTYSMSNVELTETVESHNEQISKNTEMIAETSSQTTLNHSTLGYQRKNLLKNTAASRTINGVTLTVNEDGSVTLNGTATATVFFEIRKGMLLETGKEYIFSGCPVGGSTSSYALLIEDSSQGRTWDFGEGIKFTATSTNYDVKIRINVNYTAENLTFRPMLRYAEITDDAYEPYKPSVEERLAVLEEKFAALEGGGT